MEAEQFKDFCDVFNLQNLIKEPTCSKSVLNPSSIDVILTNKCNFFHNSIGLETGLSDYHKMTVTVLKTYLHKLKPNNIKYRSYKCFDDNSFKAELLSSLESRGNLNMKYDEFKNLFIWKCIRPFFFDKQKDFQKEIMLIEKKEITSNAKEVSEKLNNYFVDVIENLDITPFIEETEP